MDDHHERAEGRDATPGDAAYTVLSASPEGRAIASEFVATFGAFMTDRVRPVLREVAVEGGDPQSLVNGLARLMREVATSIEVAPGSARGAPGGPGPGDGPGPAPHDDAGPVPGPGPVAGSDPG